MTKYIEQETVHKRQRCHAAKYRPGESLDELRKVARNIGYAADIVEVPEFNIALVHYTVAPMGFPDEKYLPVHANRMLVAHADADYLYTMTESNFNRKYELDTEGDNEPCHKT